MSDSEGFPGDESDMERADADAEEERFLALRAAAGQVFTPSAPIDQRRLFAGRIEQIEKILDAVETKGQHAIVYGERGVGKTSLVSVVSGILANDGRIAVRVICNTGDTFARVWQRAFSSITITQARTPAGFDRAAVQHATSLGSQLPEGGGPDAVVNLLRVVKGSLFIFDEFDQVADKSVTKLFADTIKALSDFSVEATVVLVGVGDNVGDLLDSHASVERALKQILMPRMNYSELLEIINKATKELSVTFKEDAAARIVKFSQGLPHYVHALGLATTRRALSHARLLIDIGDVDAGISDAVANVERSTLDAYSKAVGTPQKKTLFKDVLLACALTRPDERGYFAPVEVRDSLKALGKPLQIPTFASHLNVFASADRGNVLQKSGSPRRFRYRFTNPLMQPYVVMKGVSDGLISATSVDEILGVHGVPPTRGSSMLPDA